MTYTQEEAQKAAEELVKLSLQVKSMTERMNDLKAGLYEWSEVENINDTSWGVDGGYVEIRTDAKKKLADIPADVTIPATVIPTDISEKAFTTKVVLSKEGKQMLKEEYPSIMNLMLSTEKKSVKVVV